MQKLPIRGRNCAVPPQHPPAQLFKGSGVSDGIRTRDVQIHSLTYKRYVIGSSSLFLHLAPRYSGVFGPYCSQVVPKFVRWTPLLRQSSMGTLAFDGFSFSNNLFTFRIGL